MNDPIAQQLLNLSVPGHLAYVWTDGTPRVIPIGFRWTGTELIKGTPSNAPKILALKEGSKVGVTFDTYTPPMRVLYIRGIMHICSFDGIVPEWHQAGERLMGKEGAEAFANMVGGMLKAGVMTMVRISVEPTWVAFWTLSHASQVELKKVWQPWFVRFHFFQGSFSALVGFLHLRSVLSSPLS